MKHSNVKIFSAIQILLHFTYERNSENSQAQRNERVASKLTLVERIGEKEERGRVSHIIVQTSVEKRPRSQFGAAKA